MGSNIPVTTKRLIACCDGTWMDSDNGYEEPGFLKSEGTLQVPSNVTRISRCFKRRCSDGKLQIISYESGVGTGSNTLDSITGGAFGLGLSERVRETYSYLCANYMDGDEIILVGYSRGAFTVRSVAGMVGALGLLTREGVEHFYPIFKDMQHWRDPDYKDPFPNVPFSNKPKGPNAAKEYRARLEKLGYTRVKQDGGDGELIKIKAVWMMDQLASVGVEFDTTSLERVFDQTKAYYETSSMALKRKKRKGVPGRWAIDPIFEGNSPIRPWGLGAINKASSLLYKLSGQTIRSPGLYKSTDPKTKLDADKFLMDTNERIHSTVRVRLACQGLGLDDKNVWDCSALLKSWKVKRTREKFEDPVPCYPDWDPESGKDAFGHPNDWSKGRWIWEYCADEKHAPTDRKQRVMVEEPLGPYERHLLKLSAGTPNVFEFADSHE
ncbi:hypothetical protein AK830_g5012 [Neonectria ditissima]|uniref:T6SS Phospholipase effector Tle1-like catalytic domain-containing protein n=1 Tax=Neonectria ditissima TaxID=78410 RepID=A0A0P7BMK9_9HYPO|nr:hypothetical protein AK830_g5012 [Neonectria ditissima]